MMFFNFQRFFAGFGSVLDPILSQENPTLEAILDEDSLQEIKLNGAQKFGSFVTKNIDTFSKMIGYLSVNEDEEYNEKTQIRYPFMISEAIGNENGPIIDYLFEADKSSPNYEQNEERRQEFLPKIFDILDRDYLNVTLASYLSKVVCAIIRRRGFDLWRFLSQPEHKSILSNLIKNLDVFHVAEIIEKLIILDTNQEQSDNQTNFLEERSELLRRVIRVFEYKTHQNDITDNCSHIIIEILNKSELFLQVLNIPEKFFAIALNSSSATVVSVLITLIEAIHRYVQQQQEKNPAYTFDYNQFYPIAQEFKNALLAEKISISAFNTTYGISQQPFSQMKLKLIQLYLSILRINNVQWINQFDHKGIYEALMKFVIEYEFNNQLQNYFYEITIFIFDRPLFDSIQEEFLSLGLISFLMKHNRYEKQNVGALNAQITRGYVGVLSKIAYYFIDKFEHNQEWNQYVEQVLEPVRTIENQFMLGVNPKPKIPIDTSDDNMNEMFKNFSKNKYSQSNQQPQLQQQDQQPAVEVEEETEEELNTDENQENIIHQREDDETEQIQEANSKKPEMLIDVEEIEKVINSPETSPKVVEQIIQFQEQNLKTSPQASEILTDQTVNKYWKAHEGLEHQEPGRKGSHDDIHKHQVDHHEQVKQNEQQHEQQHETSEKDAEKQQVETHENLKVEVQEVKVEEINSPEEQQQQGEQQLEQQGEKQEEQQLEQQGEKQEEQQLEQQGEKQEEQQQEQQGEQQQAQEEQQEQQNKQEEQEVIS
ncbi:unnamed protein product [Paramecium octaurelia]|uniref:Uncharacterized protein n=1 Tax=Paramecium octaurelia TaxID=43137 RepID=A0A8S1XKH3_PAROT|nr:unnamed protein product [Paramecium octaurelia]